MSQGNDSDRPDDDTGAPGDLQPQSPAGGQQPPADRGSGTTPGGGGGDGGDRTPSDGANNTPADQLKNLQQELDKAQDKQKQAESTVQKIEAQIAALIQLVSDFEKIGGEYEKDYDTLATAEQRFRDFKRYEQSCLANILGEDAMTEADAKAAEELSLLDELEAKVTNDTEELDALKANRTAAGKKRDAAKKSFEMWKKPASSIRERLGKLEAAMREIKAAHDAGEYAFARWLLISDKKFNGHLSGEPRTIRPDEFIAQITAAWEEYRDALIDFEAVDRQVKAAEKALQTNEALLAEMKKKLDATIRARLAKIKPKPNEAKQEMEHA